MKHLWRSIKDWWQYEPLWLIFMLGILLSLVTLAVKAVMS